MQAAGLKTFIEGKEDGPTVVFVHGFPDDHALWDKQVAHLKDRYRCVLVDLPGFNKDEMGKDKWGYSTEEVVRRLERTVETVARGKPIFLVGHDWGCWYSYNLEQKRPDLVRKMVTLDVGGDMSPPGLFANLFIVSYQIFLVFAFLLGRPIGDLMARGMAILFGAADGHRIARASTCYPYYHMWKFVLTNGMKKMTPQCPVLYIYGCAGAKMLMQFHSPRWLEKIAQKGGISECVAMKEGGHWMMREYPAEVNSKLDKFFEAD